MQRPAKPSTPVRFRLQPPYFLLSRPGGGIGRHKGLKIPRGKLRAGSSPAPGTIFYFFTISSSRVSITQPVNIADNLSTIGY